MLISLLTYNVSLVCKQLEILNKKYVLHTITKTCFNKPFDF